MPLTISDETLRAAGLNEREALIEFACRLFDAGKLSLPAASKMAGLGRVEFESELFARDIPAYRVTLEDYLQDMAALKRLGI
jgi:predicted HTH domain antitoxin